MSALTVVYLLWVLTGEPFKIQKLVFNIGIGTCHWQGVCLQQVIAVHTC